MKGERGNLTIETLAKLAVELGLTMRLESAPDEALEMMAWWVAKVQSESNQ